MMGFLLSAPPPPLLHLRPPFAFQLRACSSSTTTTNKLSKQPLIRGHLTSFPAAQSAVFLALPLLLTPPANSISSLDVVLSHSSRLLQALPVADLDPSLARLLIGVLGPVFASLNFLFIIRIVMSWYPQLPVDKFPYVIAFAPTEPVLEPTRRLIPPVGGVDVSPVVWVALLSFFNEVLLGQQGLLILLSQQQS